MSHGNRTTLDRAGRLVLPKPVREAAGLLPGMELDISVTNGKVEIAPAPRDVRLVDRGGLQVAVPQRETTPLGQEEVWKTLRAIRNRDS